jgi:hypothetical protein
LRPCGEEKSLFSAIIRRYLNDEDLSFLTADRKLVVMTQRSLESDRIYLWSELAETGPSRHAG